MIQKCASSCDKACNPCGSDDIFCIDTHRIYDSSRCQDCMESLRLLLAPGGVETVSSSSTLKVKECRVIWADIDTDEMPFNCGYYQITVRYYIYVVLTCCVAGCPVDVPGLAIGDKTVVLYGGEGDVQTFSTDTALSNPCHSKTEYSSNRPRVVVEVATPVALHVSVEDNTCPLAYPAEFSTLPDAILCHYPCGLDCTPDACSSVYISIGLFALIRIERPTQLIIPACDYCIPDADKTPVSTGDPCSLFCSTPFPVSEFYPDTCKNN